MSAASHARALNTPEDSEMYELPYQANNQKEERLPNAAMFTFFLEGHTLGDATRMQLLRDPTVLFAGYSVPHPLEFKMQMRVQVQDNERVSPSGALLNAMNCLTEECSLIEQAFDAAMHAYQSNNADADANMASAAYSAPFEMGFY